MDAHLSRRTFLAGAAGTFAAGCATTPGPSSTATPAVQPVRSRVSLNEKLQIAGIGVGGMGRANLNACVEEDVVALCDVDDAHAAETFAAFPDAGRYRDYRELFEEEGDRIDAVIIATPDHTHAVIAMEAMRRGKHVFCQKPLAHNLHEVRQLTEAARRYGVQTQMGNQGHSSDAMRRLREWIEDGAIGPVHEVHAWSDRPVGGDPWSDFPIMARPEETPPVPEGLDWDLWLGPAQARPYHPIYHPLSWRGFLDFGTGALGDMGTHILDPAFYALQLGHPTRVQASTTHYEEAVSRETFPRASIVRYEFPARGGMPPVKLTWYDGRLRPPVPPGIVSPDDLRSNGAIFLGEDGIITHGSHGASHLQLHPQSLRDRYEEPPQRLPRVPQVSGAHEKDWIRACKDGRPASASFDYGGPLTEMVLLGVLAMRRKDTLLEWDGDTLQVTNDAEANALVRKEYRDGWSL